MYILQVVKNIFQLLTHAQRLRLYFILVFFLGSALIQVAGVASIAPFITLLSNPDIAKTHKFFSVLYGLSGAASPNQFVVYFAVLSLLMIVISNFVSALSMWVLFRFSIYIGGELQSRLYENILRREYIFHKMSNYNKVISTITNEAPRFVYMVLQQFLLLLSQLFVAVLILVGLLLINPFIAFASAFLIGGAYLVTYLFVKKSMMYHGAVLTEKNDQMQRILSESFIGVKDIKLSALESVYIERLTGVNYQGLKSAAFIALAGDIPRFVIETISFGAILVLAIVLLMTSGSSQSAISLLSVYALAGYKLLPTLQQVYKSISNLSAHGAVVAELRQELSWAVTDNTHVNVTKMPQVGDLALSQISYIYPNNTSLALDDINVAFKLGELNTIAGHSGSGKSTLADVMLGLLRPSTGCILVNGEEAKGAYLQQYQRSIGYVPQNIFIVDDTVVANVAFGVPKDQIDLAKVDRALKQANAYEFVARLPFGVNTQLGQDGKLLSGGQRQRIGIARTLYRENRILILDEPTSALDIESEYELMLLLGQLKTEVLIVVISHRPAAIKLSDKITIVDAGKIVAHGSYENLMQENEKFKELMQKGMMV